MTQRWRGAGGREGGGEKASEMGATSSANGCNHSHTASQLHCRAPMHVPVHRGNAAAAAAAPLLVFLTTTTSSCPPPPSLLWCGIERERGKGNAVMRRRWRGGGGGRDVGLVWYCVCFASASSSTWHASALRGW